MIRTRTSAGKTHGGKRVISWLMVCQARYSFIRSRFRLLVSEVDREHYLLDDVQKSSSSFLSQGPQCLDNVPWPAGAKRQVGPTGLLIDQKNLLQKQFFKSKKVTFQFVFKRVASMTGGEYFASRKEHHAKCICERQ
jgi:hypothetical protein